MHILSIKKIKKTKINKILPSGHEQINSPRPSIHKPPWRHGELEHSSMLIWHRSPENAFEHKQDSRLSWGLIKHVPLFKHLFWQRFDIWKHELKAIYKRINRWKLLCFFLFRRLYTYEIKLKWL